MVLHGDLIEIFYSLRCNKPDTLACQRRKGMRRDNPPKRRSVMSLHSRGRTAWAIQHRAERPAGHHRRKATTVQQLPPLQPPTPVNTPGGAGRGRGGATAAGEERRASFFDDSGEPGAGAGQRECIKPCGCGDARVSPPSQLGRCDTDAEPPCNDRRRRSNRWASRERYHAARSGSWRGSVVYGRGHCQGAPVPRTRAHPEVHSSTAGS